MVYMYKTYIYIYIYVNIYEITMLQSDTSATTPQVPIQDIAWKISWEWWTIEMGGERGSGRSVLAAGQDDDDIWNSGLKENVGIE